MGNCLRCKKEIEVNTGRRPRKYCSDNCRQRDYQGKKKEKVAKTDFEPNTASKNEKKTKSRQRESNPPVEAENEFMGHAIPDGLIGIPLMRWKNELKLKIKNEQKEALKLKK